MTSQEHQKLSSFLNKPTAVQRMTLRILIIGYLVLGGLWVVTPAFAQPIPGLIVSPTDFWNVTDITDPGLPVEIGDLQTPFADTMGNTTWHYYNQDNYILDTPPGILPSQAYGTTPAGGTNGLGTIFSMIANTNTPNLSPNELLVCGSVIYGTTRGNMGSDYNPNPYIDPPTFGTVFKVNVDGTGFVTLYTFKDYGDGGGIPLAGLVMDNNGVLYGTTSGSGYGDGEVFSIHTNGTGFTVLYSFIGSNHGGYDGSNPKSKLVLSGNILYGTTSGGGTNGLGTVFCLTTNGTNYKEIHAFSGWATINGVRVLDDGAEYNGDSNPQSGLILSNGVLYGTTPYGGFTNDGTVFRMNTDGSDLQDLHDFGVDPNDGIGPDAGLALSDGVLYGTTPVGGPYGDQGLVFSIATNGSNYQVLYDFLGYWRGLSPGGPEGTLVIDNGVLYGTTTSGGSSYNDGAVFSMNPDGSNFTNLYAFNGNSEGGTPLVALALSDGLLYGTTCQYGPGGGGSIFRITTNGIPYGFTLFPPADTYSVTNIHTFSGINGDGAVPIAQLAMSGSSAYGAPIVLYGTTSSGGTNGHGSIFSINSDGSGYTDLHSFGSSDPQPQYLPGDAVTGGKLLISANTLYGTTVNTVYKINTDGTGFTTLANVNNSSELVLSLSGKTLYGTTPDGGVHSKGAVFSVNTDGSGSATLYSFGSISGDGATPEAGLDLSPNAFYNEALSPTSPRTGEPVAVLYGTTAYGGATTNGHPANGTVFSINTDGSGFQTLYTFGNTTGDGAQPEASMILSYGTPGASGPVDDILYGTTYAGGAYGLGTVFWISNGVFSTLWDFSGPDGSGPRGKLTVLGIPYSNPYLMGTTSGGGAYGKGTIFNLSYYTAGENLLNDFYDFNGTNGASPYAGVTSAVWDHSDSIWSLDKKLVFNGGTPSISFSNIDSRYIEVFANGNLVYSTNSTDGWQPPVALGYLQPGTNDIRVVIGSSGDEGSYFTMAIYTNLPPVITNTATLFVGSYGGHNITEFSDGIQSVFDTNYNYPTGLAFDDSGDLFAADQFGGKIYKYSSGGTKTTFKSGLNQPSYMAYYGGYLYVTMDNTAIDEFDSAGTLVGIITAGLTNVMGLAFDSAGNLYVANLNGGAAGAGSIVEISGGVTSVYASGLSYPDGIAFDSSGDLFVGGGNLVDTITEIPPGGGTGTVFASGLNNPADVAVDAAGNIWVADCGAYSQNGDITEFDPSGNPIDVITSVAKPMSLAFNITNTPTVFAGSYGSGNIAEISGGLKSVFDTGYSYPTGLAFDDSGDLFAADQFGGKIYKYSGGTKTTFKSGLNQPSYMAYYGGNLYVTMDNTAIDEFDSTGTLVNTVTVGLTNVMGLAFDSAGNLYVANLNGGAAGAGSIVEISGGVTSVYASGLSYPDGIAFDSSGDLFVGGGNLVDTITEIPPGGGTGTVFASGLNNPADVAVDSAGNVWAADCGAYSSNGDITEFDPYGNQLQVITTIAKPMSLAIQ